MLNDSGSQFEDAAAQPGTGVQHRAAANAMPPGVLRLRREFPRKSSTGRLIATAATFDTSPDDSWPACIVQGAVFSSTDKRRSGVECLAATVGFVHRRAGRVCRRRARLSIPTDQHAALSERGRRVVAEADVAGVWRSLLAVVIAAHVSPFQRPSAWAGDAAWPDTLPATVVTMPPTGGTSRRPGAKPPDTIGERFGVIHRVCRLNGPTAALKLKHGLATSDGIVSQMVAAARRRAPCSTRLPQRDGLAGAVEFVAPEVVASSEFRRSSRREPSRSCRARRLRRRPIYLR